LRIAPSAVESHIRAELASSPPAIEHSIALGGKTHSHRTDRDRRHNNSVYIIGSQPLPSPSPSVSLGSGAGRSWNSSWRASPNINVAASPMHAQFEQLALRMSKLVVEEDERGSELVPSGSVGEKTSATSSCAASAIFSITGGSGWTSETDETEAGQSQDGPVSNSKLSILDGPSLLSRTAPLGMSVTPMAPPTPSSPEDNAGIGAGVALAVPLADVPEDQVSVKIADLGNAARIGKHVTGTFKFHSSLILFLFQCAFLFVTLFPILVSRFDFSRSCLVFFISGCGVPAGLSGFATWSPACRLVGWVRTYRHNSCAYRSDVLFSFCTLSVSGPDLPISDSATSLLHFPLRVVPV
jgi:hypothetical protein